MKKIYVQIIFLLILFTSTFFILSSRWSEQVDYRSIAHIFSLITFERWDNEGAQHFYYAPVVNYNNPIDMFVDIYPRVFDNKGNNYYLSHPPGSFLLSYSIIKSFHLPIDQVSLQKILFIYFVFSIIGIAILLNILFSKKIIPILVGIFVYTFHPLILYSFTFYHFAETIGLVFFIWILVFHLLVRKNPNNKLYVFLHNIFLFIFLLIDWVAFIYAIFYIIYSFKKKNRKDALLIIILTIIAYAIIFIQYSSIDGVQPFMHHIWLRYIDRIGIFSSIFKNNGFGVLLSEILRLIFNCIHNLLKGTGILLFLVIIPMIKDKSIFKENHNLNFIFYWVFVPIFLFSILVFSVALTHYIYTAKFVLFICLIIAYVFDKYFINIEQKWFQASVLLIFIITITWSLNIYNQFYEYDPVQLKLDNEAKIFSQKANQSDRCIYILGKNQNPHELVYITYKAKRNLMLFYNFDDFNNWYLNNLNIDCYYIISNN
ncbi:MAG: hypothetical protein WCS63_07975 [Bacteroidales bacterium]|jgi:hypothetical protein|nr:hypothetical protein [Bacteroidales bacterium]